MSLPAFMKGAMLLGPRNIDVRELPVPRPGDGEILLRIDAATTCGTDVKVFRRGGHPRMLKVPTLFGHEMAGTAVALGRGVNSVREGQRLVVSNSAPCGHCDACTRGRENLCRDLEYLNGAFAEYILIPSRFVERSLYPLDDSLASERAALSEPLACVVHGIDACREALLQPAQVVIIGGGPIGLLFVACLACDGHQVLLADPNSSRIDAARAMGAAQAVRVPRDETAARVLQATLEAPVDLAIDCTGSPSAWSLAISLVRPGGMVNLFGGCAPGTSVSLDTHRVHYSEITIKGVYHHRPDSFRRALARLTDPDFPASQLLSARRPIDAVAEALEDMIEKRALKVIIAG